ncbi:hypothetical protein HMPREF9442_01912 [Paraprevotella xylaniphila YIT 11841]|uniref:Uncharacterized protein n=1 Tax=Paraprevotella xylaniphila YIT 11841 TaxID=762982 RepID=F3QUN9_9BACT|nr:hypothetical protein HMPREF9442_01912 [Paraprevotella xylaniphila YIT 11841]
MKPFFPYFHAILSAITVIPVVFVTIKQQTGYNFLIYVNYFLLFFKYRRQTLDLRPFWL